MAGAAVRQEPMAYAKIATREDALPPFYITDEHVKETDEQGNPTRIELVLGRSPGPGNNPQLFNADFHIGNRMKISKRHATIYWTPKQEKFEIKSICKNAVRVNGSLYPGSPDGQQGRPAELVSRSCIEIADGNPLYFLLPKAGKPAGDKPKLTYEQLINSVVEEGQELTLSDIILRIQEKYPYYADESLQDSSTWKGSLRTTLNQKTKVFEKTVRVDDESGKKVQYWGKKRDTGDEGEEPAAGAGSAGASADQ